MLESRASFGCTISSNLKEIYVAGGYTFGNVGRKAEKYSITEDKWSSLPQLNEDKCSCSLCVLDNKYLYVMGGLSKSDHGGIHLI